MRGSSTSSTRTSSLPCQTTAFMGTSGTGRSAGQSLGQEGGVLMVDGHVVVADADHDQAAPAFTDLLVLARHGEADDRARAGLRFGVGAQVHGQSCFRAM